MAELTDHERRVLAHLPRYRSNAEHAKAEKAMREAADLPEDWSLPRSVTLPQLEERIGRDEFTSNDGVTDALESLESRGLVKSAGDAVAMTADGLAVLTS